MRITVHLHTILQRQTPQGPVSLLELNMEDGRTLGDLIRQLEIELTLDQMLLAVNHRTAEPDHVLIDGDVVNLMPAISGG